MLDLTFREMCCLGGEQASKDLLVIPFPAFFPTKVPSCRFAVKMVGKSSKFLLHMVIEGCFFKRKNHLKPLVIPSMETKTSMVRIFYHKKLRVPNSPSLLFFRTIEKNARTHVCVVIGQGVPKRWEYHETCYKHINQKEFKKHTLQIKIQVHMYILLVVSTHLKNISQIGNLPQIGM